jgi:hypothetical protein
MPRLYREHVLGEKPQEGFVSLDSLIAPAPGRSASASESKEEPVMGD